MEVNQQAITAMQAVTVSRQYGSGGGEIATRLARKLGWRLIDHLIIEQTARELGIYETDVARFDEDYVEGTLARILNGIRTITSGGFMPAVSGAPIPSGAPIIAASHPAVTTERAYQETMQQVVRAAAAGGRAVIVGRGGQFILADQRNVLHLRVVAPLEQRVAYVKIREQLSDDAARHRIQEKDRARERNMQNQFRQQPDNAELYDLVINTAVLDLDTAVDLVCLALENKASRLGLPAEKLGPAAGLAPYVSKPADFSVASRSSANKVQS